MVTFLLYKNTWNKIKKSLGRYLSLFIIVMVGVGFFAGIQATAPDMLAVADGYYDTQWLMDFKIVSTMGLTDDDVRAVQELKGVAAVMPSYSLDVLDQEKAIRVHGIEDGVNTVRLTEGRMPINAAECIGTGGGHWIFCGLHRDSKADLPHLSLSAAPPLFSCTTIRCFC